MRNLGGILVVLATFACPAGSLAQDSGQSLIPPHPRCGDPLEISGAYLSIDRFEHAKVVGVADGRTLTVQLKSHERILVRLAGVRVEDLGSGGRSQAAECLGGAVGSEAEVLFLDLEFERLMTLNEVEARVFSGGKDLGLRLLEEGLASYEESRHLRAFEGCLYRIAEEEARSARRGRWATEVRVSSQPAGR